MAGDAGREDRNQGVMHLGEVRAGVSKETTGPTGVSPATYPNRRWMVMVAVFLVGAVVGGYAWLVRSDILESARVDLIVTEIRHEPPQSDGTLTRVVVYVRNVGDEEVMLTRAWLPGQAADGRIRETVIPAGETVAIALDGELNCKTGLPEAIEADVQTPTGQVAARLPVPVTNLRYDWSCGPAERVVWVENARSGIWTSAQPIERMESGLAVTIPLRIRSWSVDEVEVAGIAVSDSPGLAAEARGMVGRHETRTVAEVEVEWTVAACSDRYRGEPIDLTVSFADHPPATAPVPEPVLPMLIATVDMVCES